MELMKLNTIIGKIKLAEFWYALLLASLPLPFNFQNGIFIGFVLVIVYYKIIFKSNSSRIRIYHLLSYLIYLLIITSVLWSTNKIISIEIGFLRFINFVLIPSVFLIWDRSKVSIQRILIVFSCFVTFWALFFITNGVYHWLTQGSIGKLLHHELVGIFDLNRIYVSVMVFISILYLILNIKVLGKVLKIFLVIQTFFLFLLSSKLLIILGVLSIVLVYAIKIKKALKILVLAGVLAISFVIVSSLNNGKLITELKPNLQQTFYSKKLGQLYYANGINLRMLYIRFYIELVKEDRVDFFLGSGVGTSQIMLNRKIDEYDMWRGYKEFNYHNQYIQGLSEMGFLYPLILISFLVLGIRKFFLDKNYFGIGIVFMFTLLFLSESFLYRQRGIYLFLLIYFLLIDTKFDHSHNKNAID
ncbi:MAG: O-antigen ligase family protein [Jejuia sp.]